MMQFRVTKYSPTYRDERGRYLRNDWTSVSDIGKTFDADILTVDKYLVTENAYIDAVKVAMESVGVDRLAVSRLEKYRDLDDLLFPLRSDISVQVGSIHNRMVASGKALEDIIRLCLREIIWCKLRGKKGFFVHFGYDYYMYIGCDDSIDWTWVSEGAVYIEKFSSPHFP